MVENTLAYEYLFKTVSLAYLKKNNEDSLPFRQQIVYPHYTTIFYNFILNLPKNIIIFYQ